MIRINSGNVVKASDKKQENPKVVNEIQPDLVGSEVTKTVSITIFVRKK